MLYHTDCQVIHSFHGGGMKRVLLLAAAALFFLASQATAAVIEPARLKFIEGEVLLRTPDADDWQTASINVPLDEGDSLWCQEGGKAELELADGSILRISGGSQLNILSNEKDFFHVNLAKGRVYVKNSPYARANSLQIDADDTTVLPDARTRLRLDMFANGQEDVSIFKGAAYVEGSGSRTRVRAGEHIALEERHSELLPLNPPDSWEGWNMDRDRMQSASGKGGTYLPEELRTHATELDANGSWVSSAEYGMVWRPSASVSSDWSPYSSGRWVWRGDDYVWIAAEPWGWIPYHYGRWTVVTSLGWCWIPPTGGDVYWGPGYVGWFQNGSSIAWTPLAPGEIFYGYGYYGRYSINISTTVVNINIINYRNRNHRGGVIHMPHNDFVRGGRVTPRHAAASADSLPVLLGSPRVKPEVNGRRPPVKERQPEVRSPKAGHRDSRELRDRFPRVMQQLERKAGGEIKPQRLNPPFVRNQQIPGAQKAESAKPEQGRRSPQEKKVWRVKSSEQGGKERENKRMKND